VVAGTLLAITRQLLQLERCSNPPDSASLLVPSQKKFSVLGLEFSWGNVTSGDVLAFLWPILTGPGRPSNGPTFWPKYFLETRLSYEFLERLIGFLAYLDQKLCHKPKSGQIFYPYKR